MDIEIRALKHDGTQHLSYRGSVLSRDDKLTRTHTPPNAPLIGSKDDVTRENLWGHFWSDRWFNVICYDANALHPAGWYCNITSPAASDGDVISYVDYELDVRVLMRSDGSLEWFVLDEDEFEEACTHYGYDEALILRCRAAVDAIIAMVEAREFPFDEPPQTP
jgi:protein associated with RNAse G/E